MFTNERLPGGRSHVHTMFRPTIRTSDCVWTLLRITLLFDAKYRADPNPTESTHEAIPGFAHRTAERSSALRRVYEIKPGLLRACPICPLKHETNIRTKGRQTKSNITDNESSGIRLTFMPIFRAYACDNISGWYA